MADNYITGISWDQGSQTLKNNNILDPYEKNANEVYNVPAVNSIFKAISERVDHVGALGEYLGSFDYFRASNAPAGKSTVPQTLPSNGVFRDDDIVTVGDFVTVRVDNNEYRGESDRPIETSEEDWNRAQQLLPPEDKIGKQNRYVVESISDPVDDIRTITWAYDITYTTDVTGKMDRFDDPVAGGKLVVSVSQDKVAESEYGESDIAGILDDIDTLEGKVDDLEDKKQDKDKDVHDDRTQKIAVFNPHPTDKTKLLSSEVGPPIAAFATKSFVATELEKLPKPTWASGRGRFNGTIADMTTIGDQRLLMVDMSWRNETLGYLPRGAIVNVSDLTDWAICKVVSDSYEASKTAIIAAGANGNYRGAWSSTHPYYKTGDIVTEVVNGDEIWYVATRPVTSARPSENCGPTDEWHALESDDENNARNCPYYRWRTVEIIAFGSKATVEQISRLYLPSITVPIPGNDQKIKFLIENKRYYSFDLDESAALETGDVIPVTYYRGRGWRREFVYGEPFIVDSIGVPLVGSLVKMHNLSSIFPSSGPKYDNVLWRIVSDEVFNFGGGGDYHRLSDILTKAAVPVDGSGYEISGIMCMLYSIGDVGDPWSTVPL